MATLGDLLASTKTPKSDRMRLSAMLDITQRAIDSGRGKTPQQLIADVPASMYENPIVNAAIGFTPVVGDIQSGVEALRSAAGGRWGESALNGVGVLPFLPSMAGMVKGMGNIEDALKAGGKTQYEIAHEVAQRNAALPVEQGGLGLPPDNTAMDRARAMGFNDGLYHGGTNDFTSFKVSDRSNVYATDDPKIADIYANATGRHKALREVNADPNVISLMYRGKLAEVSDQGPTGGGWYQDNLSEQLGIERSRRMVKELPQHGFSGLKIKQMDDLGGRQTQYVFPDPSVLRSRFAAFDPMRRNESDLLAGLAPWMIPTTLAGLLSLGAANEMD